MKLHWSPRSPFVRKVMLAAHELGLAERIELVRTQVSMSAVNIELQKDNPLGQIPTLILDDGAVLYDSAVICDYLNEVAGGSLFPQSGSARWDTLKRHALANGLLSVLILYRNERNKAEHHRTAEWLAGFASKVEHCLDHMECVVAARQNAFDIGDITFGCALSYLDFRFNDIDWRQSRAALDAWQSRFSKRPSALANPVTDDA